MTRSPVWCTPPAARTRANSGTPTEKFIEASRPPLSRPLNVLPFTLSTPQHFALRPVLNETAGEHDVPVSPNVSLPVARSRLVVCTLGWPRSVRRHILLPDGSNRVINLLLEGAMTLKLAKLLTLTVRVKLSNDSPRSPLVRTIVSLLPVVRVLNVHNLFRVSWPVLTSDPVCLIPSPALLHRVRVIVSNLPPSSIRRHTIDTPRWTLDLIALTPVSLVRTVVPVLLTENPTPKLLYRSRPVSTLKPAAVEPRACDIPLPFASCLKS